MDKQTSELIQKYLDRAISTTELVELEAMLQSDSQAAEAFANATRMHAALEATFREEASTRNVTAMLRELETEANLTEVPQREIVVKEAGPSRGRRASVRGFRTGWATAAAAMLLIIIGSIVYWGVTTNPAPVESHRVIGGQVFTNGAASDVLRDGDSITVGEDGPALIQLADGSKVELEPASRAVLHGVTEQARQVVELVEGRGAFRVTDGGGQFKVKTSIGQVNVLGTEFTVKLLSPEKGEDKTKKAARMTVMVRSGVVRVDIANQSYTVREGDGYLFAAEGPQLATPLAGSASDFKPDPSKTYYIDCPDTGARLSADGTEVSVRRGSWSDTFAIPKAVEQSEKGTNVKWAFVPVGDRWHIQLANGGDNPRLWAVKLPQLRGLAMIDTDTVGGWTQFTITDAGNGKYFLTAPEGPKPFRRLYFVGGEVGMGQSTEKGPGFQVTITEATSAE